MREIRTSGSEGGGIESNRFSLPLSFRRTAKLPRSVDIAFASKLQSGGIMGPGFRRDDDEKIGSLVSNSDSFTASDQEPDFGLMSGLPPGVPGGGITGMLCGPRSGTGWARPGSMSAGG
jgi:hypothetical protein